MLVVLIFYHNISSWRIITIYEIILDCKDCYGAQLSDDQCCNNCEEVVRAYNDRNWGFDRTQFLQCNIGRLGKCVSYQWNGLCYCW